MITVIYVLGFIGMLILLLLVIGLFTRKGYSIERDIIINKPVSEVFQHLRFLKNQDHFSKWVMMDPNLKKSYRGTDGTVGFVYAWEGNKKAGKGEQEIKQIKEGERLDIEIRFKEPFEAIASTPFITEALPGNQTKVRWGLTSEMKYPMNVMLLFMNIEKMLGKDLEVSLSNLKRVLEQ